MVGEERKTDRQRGVTVGERGMGTEILSGVVPVEKNNRFVVAVVLRKHRRKMSKFNKRFP